jgi:PAS domain S-box-containing protein
MISAFIVVIVVVLTGFTLFAVVREGNKAKESLREQGEMLSGLLARGSLTGVFAENRKMIESAAEGTMGLTDVVSVSIYNADLRLLYSNVKTPSGKDSLSVRDNDVHGLRTAAAVSVVETGRTFEFLRPVTIKSAPSADESVYFGRTDEAKEKVIGYVRIILSKHSYHNEIISLLSRNALIMLVFILSSIVIFSLAIKNVTRPLKNLTEGVKALGKGMHVEPVAVETDDEVGNLASAFNAMVIARGRAEESLRDSEERYRRLVELSPDAIFVARKGKIVFINAAGARLFGASEPSQLLERPVRDFIHQDYREAVQKSLLEVEENAVPAPLLQARYLRLEGTAVDVEAAAAPFIFRGMAAALVIARDITERRSLEEKIYAYQRELRSAALEMSAIESRVEERERHLIAADLHDFVGQNLVVMQFKLAALLKSPSFGELMSHVEEIRELIRRTIQYTRSLTVELSPPILVEIGFTAAVEALAEGFEKTHGIPVSVEDDGRPKEIDDDTRYLLFRSVRELLMNVVKHSEASCVKISIGRTDGLVHVVVEDNGKGSDMAKVSDKKGGFGLFTIRQRLKGLGGYCEIESRPAAGTKVTLAAPLK